MYSISLLVNKEPAQVWSQLREICEDEGSPGYRIKVRDVCWSFPDAYYMWRHCVHSTLHGWLNGKVTTPDVVSLCIR